MYHLPHLIYQHLHFQDQVQFLGILDVHTSMPYEPYCIVARHLLCDLDKQGFLVACRYVAIVQYGVLKDDNADGETLNLEVFQRYMNDDKVPIPKFDN